MATPPKVSLDIHVLAYISSAGELESTHGAPINL